MAEDFLTRRARELAEEERQRRVQAARNRALQKPRPASEVARSRQLAERYGVAPELIDDDPEPFVVQDKLEQTEGMLEKYPWMTNILLDPSAAAMIPDADLPKIGKLSDALMMPESPKPLPMQIDLPTGRLAPPPPPPAPRPKPRNWTVGDYVTRVPVAALGMVGEGLSRIAGGIVGGAEAVTDTVGLGEETNDYWREVNRGYEALIDSVRPDWLENSTVAGYIPASAIQDGGVSFVQMLAPLPLGKKAVLGTLVGSTAGSAYTKYQERGGGYWESLLGATGEGTIEWATERTPIGWLDNVVGGGKAGSFIKEFFIPDVIGEQVATIGQDALDTAIANPDKTWADYWAERPEAAFHTLIATLTTAGLVKGGESTLRRLGKIADTSRDSVDGFIGQKILDDVMDRAATVELRNTAPEEFAKIVEAGAAGSPVRHVYLPIEAVDAILQDETIPDEEKAAITFYQDQIDEARLNNSELVIPIGEAAAKFAGTTMWQKVREEARVIAGGLSGREAREWMETVSSEIETLGKQALEDAEALTPAIASKVNVFEAVRQQMLSAGRSDAEAKTTAILMSSRAETLASARYGKFKNAEEAWEWMKLRIENGETSGATKGKGSRYGQLAATDTLPAETRDDVAHFIAEKSGRDINEVRETLYGGGGLVDPVVAPVVAVNPRDIITAKATSSDVVGSYAERSANTAPPVLVKKTQRGWQLVEGGHRLAAALRRGDDAIAAVDVTNLETADWDGFFDGDEAPDVPLKSNNGKARSAFTDVTKLLERDDWAMLTAENPMGEQASPEFNAQRMAELKADLDAMGLKYTEARGVYGQEENSLAVEGITEDQAIELGRRYGQDSVLTRSGLIYSDGTIEPAVGVKILDKDVDNYFTELPDGTKFAVDINFNARLPRGKTANEAVLWTPEQVDALIAAYQNPDGTSRAMVVMLSPDEFLSAMASEKGVSLIEQRVAEMPEYGRLDLTKLGTSGYPTMTVAFTPEGDRSGPMVRGHDGRHRAMMMKRAGVTQMPVVVNLITKEGAPVGIDSPVRLGNILPNRSRANQVENGSLSLTLQGIPLNDAHRGQLLEGFAAAPAETQFDQTVVPVGDEAATIGAAQAIARGRRFKNMREFKLAIQKGVKGSGRRNLRNRKRLITLAVADAEVALRENSNAIGWYNDKVVTALEVLAALHPEINTDPNARFAFVYALAVTSNGLKVDRNFALANQVYEAYKRHGKMPIIGEGTASQAIKASLHQFNELVGRVGIDGLREFMLRNDVTVREVEQFAGITVSGEYKGTTVTGAAFLGPKIGNGFFSNLYGNFDQLTMDRWFIRTWGRWTGTLVNVSPAKTKAKMETVKNRLRALSTADRKKLEQILSTPTKPFKLKLTDIEGFVARLNTATAKKEVRDQLKALDPSDRIRLDGKQLFVLLDGQKEAPDGPKERNEIRSIMVPVLHRLREAHPGLTMADLQAVLWYPEKTLYEMSKATGEGSTGYADDEAPDYANAAVALAKQLGVSEEKINEAIEAAKGKLAPATRRPDPAGSGAGAAPTLVFAEDRNGFPAEDGLSSERDGTEDPTTYAQFGGEKGARQDRSVMRQLGMAEVYENHGMPAEKIWKKTGWRRDVDGLWRFEIDDRFAKWVLDGPVVAATNAEGNPVGFWLEEVLDHPELFIYYPQLRKMPVIALDLDANTGGYFGGTHIVLKSGDSAEAQLSVLHHELAHAIQAIEGFSNGSSGSRDALRYYGLEPDLDETIEYYTAIANGDVPGMRFPREMSPEEIEASAAYNVYWRTLGEVEARNVQKRAKMSTRRNLPFPEKTASVAADQRLVSFPFPENDIGPYAMSQKPTAPQPKAKRGDVTFYPDGRTIVRLFAKADFSTVLHELSHTFLQQEFMLAKEPGASEELKADVERLTKWFESNGVPVGADGMPGEGAHELFARTGERYFREGKAPSSELRSAFKQLKDWLTGVYKSVKDLLVFGPAPINPEIREIFDRIIATDEAIELNKTEPMSKEDLGMSDAEYDAYLASVQNSQDKAYDTLLAKMMSAIRLREKRRESDQRRAVRAMVSEEINKERRFIALHLLRTGRWLGDQARDPQPVKINTGWLIDNYGEDVLQRLPVGLQPLHRGDGLVGDDIAMLIDPEYTGDEMIRDLLELKVQADELKASGNPTPLRDQLIKEEVDRRMAARTDDIALNEEQIRQEAIAAINSENQGQVLAAELRQLRKTKGKPGAVTPYTLLREWANRKISEGTVRETASRNAVRRWIRAYEKATKLFEEALAKRDDNETIKQKQAQLINHALVAEGKAMADRIDRIVKRMERYARTKAMASIDQDYMDRIHELLEGYNFRKVSDAKAKERESFEAWAEKQRAAGHEVYVPPQFRDDRTNYMDAKVAKLLELNDMVQSLVALGKLKQRLTTARRDRELKATIDDVESRILNLPERDVGESSTGETSRSFGSLFREKATWREWRKAVIDRIKPGARVRAGASELVKVEGLIDVLDGTKDGTGPLNQHIIQPATEAANKFSELMDRAMLPLVELYKGMSRKQAARMRDFITINELTLNVSVHEADTDRLGKPLRIPRMKLIGLLLNTGNLSNLSKLVGGERWGNPESAADLDRVRSILISYASKEDLDLVQSIWDGVGKLWPDIVEAERQMTGIVPEQVVPMEMDTPHGLYSGGYWPVVWDASRSDMGRRQQEDAETSLQGVGFGIGTPKGHTITRTGAVAPIEWSVEYVLFGHLNKVISRIAYGPWIRDALKILDNPRVTGAIRLRLGEEYVKQLKPWLRDQIPSSTIDLAGAKTWEKWLDQIRINMSIAVLGVSYTTGVAQMLGLGYSAGTLGDGSVRAGGKWMSIGMWEAIKLNAQMLRGGGNAQDFVFARSEEMRRRVHELNQESAEVFRKLQDKDTPYRRMQALAFWHIGFIDLNMVSLPTWLGGYKKALSQGLSEDDAIAYAEKMVRLSQGSGRKKDLSAIQRGGAGQKFISLFYTPSSVFFNQQWEAAQHLKAGNWSNAIAPTFWFLVMASLADALREGDWPEDDEEDGLGGMDVAEWVMRNLFFGMFYGVPIARDIANTSERKIRGEYAEYGSTPLSMMLETAARGGNSIKKFADPEEETDGRDVRNVVSGLGFIFGLPGNQFGKSAGFVEDVRQGNQEPDGVYDWYQGLAYGKLPEDEGEEK